MSQSSLSVVPIFASPFGIVQIDDAGGLNPAAAAAIDARLQSGGVQPNALTQQSGENLLEWSDAPVQSLCRAILQGIWSMATSLNRFSDEELKTLSMQARARCSVVLPNGALPARSHPLTSWCAIYCVEAPAASGDRQDSGVLRLYESRLGTMFSDATNTVPVLPYTPGHFTWRPVPGHMAIFPGFMRHEIALVRSSGRLVLVSVRARFVAPGQEGVSRW
jgi:hypothetical protein